MDTLDDIAITLPYKVEEEEKTDYALRPHNFKGYIGQDSIKESLIIAVESAKIRKSCLDHVLLYGPPGLGKTTLAFVLAKEMGVEIKVTSGPAITKAGDLAAIMTNLNDGDLLFVDEIHRLPRIVEEILYPAMEDRCLDITVGKGPTARSIRLDLPAFTLVGATTRAGMLSNPLRDRFGLMHRLEFYNQEELTKILKRSSQLLEMNIEESALSHIASRSRKTPRVANRLLRRVRDFAVYHRQAVIGRDLVEQALHQLHIDKMGLNKNDRQIIELIHSQFNNGPVGLDTLAAASGEEIETLEDLIEPYLMQIGFLDRTPRGRVITENALKYFGWQIKEFDIK